MQTITAQNVNDAFLSGMTLLAMQRNNRIETRNGPAYVNPEPVTTHYRYPTQRVLFCPERDANPFFHLLEALWMLGGQHDVARMKWLVPRMAEYSDDGKIFHATYGYRWRHWVNDTRESDTENWDQLAMLIDHLEDNFQSRRAVLQMWDPNLDLGMMAPPGAKDLPCNTTIKFSIEQGKTTHVDTDRLNMVVFNRSNDIIMGCYGANAVHLSVLQEYVAAMLGVKVGWYEQVSCDFHAYCEEFENLAVKMQQAQFIEHYRDPYTKFGADNMVVRPLVEIPATFDAELSDFLKAWDDENWNWIDEREQSHNGLNRFIWSVAGSMLLAYHMYRDQDDPKYAYTYLDHRVENDYGRIDWLVAGRDWMRRRVVARDRKRRDSYKDDFSQAVREGKANIMDIHSEDTSFDP